MKNHDNPVMSLIIERAKAKSKPLQRRDDCKLALVIEGGAMRGVVSGGMVSGLESLNLLETFDVIYGASAGVIAAAYFISRQARYGTTIYYEDINNSQFIDLLRGFRREPIVNLEYLFNDIMVHRKPLDWQAVLCSPIPLKVAVSSTKQLCTKILDNFQSRDQLFNALHASGKMPIIAGSPIVIDSDVYLDGSFFEPAPISSAMRDGCTHILTLLTRPRGRLPGTTPVDRAVIGPMLDKIKPGLKWYYLTRATRYAQMINDIVDHGHNSQNRPFICAIQLPEGSPEVSRLEKNHRKLVTAAMHGMQATINAVIAKQVSIVHQLTAYDLLGRELQPIG